MLCFFFFFSVLTYDVHCALIEFTVIIFALFCRSSERLELLKEFTDYGLEHWGSDTEVSPHTQTGALGN